MHNVRFNRPLRLAATIALLTLSAAIAPTFCAHADQLAATGTAAGSTEGKEAIAPVLVPGTSVSLVPPAGFVLSDQFSGFIDPASLSSIVIVELPPEAYAETAAIFSSTPAEVTAAFAAQGIILEVESVSSLSVGGVQVPLVEGTQYAGGMSVGKYFTVLAAENTLLLTFNVTEAGPLDEKTVVETIRSVSVTPAPSLDQKVAELPFSFEVADPFQVFDVLAASTVLLSLEGEGDPFGEAPVIVIASSVSPVLANDLATFSAQLLQGTDDFSAGTITRQSPVEFAGGEGYFIQAELSGSTIFQYVRILPDRFYIRMLVSGDAQTLEALAPAIEAIQNSVETRL